MLYTIPQGCNTVDESVPMASIFTRSTVTFLSHAFYRHIYLSLIIHRKHIRLFDYLAITYPAELHIETSVRSLQNAYLDALGQSWWNVIYLRVFSNIKSP